MPLIARAGNRGPTLFPVHSWQSRIGVTSNKDSPAQNVLPALGERLFWLLGTPQWLPLSFPSRLGPHPSGYALPRNWDLLARSAETVRARKNNSLRRGSSAPGSAAVLCCWDQP